MLVETISRCQEERKKEGIEKGREESSEKGREEKKQALLQTARNLLAMKLPIEDIAKATSLITEEIKKLTN
ncbi:MAG: hypothetical protein HQM08_27910 [Candidatus Riflebacteria bacterium]|nr:hypothetical protein [Candidatus Riflebacteria bacterium]